CALALTYIMGQRYLETSKIMPAGVVAALSALMSGFYLYKIATVGDEGVGKTALAKLVYNDPRVQKHFELKIWVCASESLDVKQLIKEIITESGTEEKQSILTDLDSLQLILKGKMMSRRFVLVLDDVRIIDSSEWQKLYVALNHGLQGSILFVTARFEGFPDGFANLINLRHIDIESNMFSAITEIGKLTSLQELPCFEVLKEDGHGIGELKDLTQLHRSLVVKNLENVESVEDAYQAKLDNKEYLNELVLEWSLSRNARSRCSSYFAMDEEVLEALRPHSKLKELEIRWYRVPKPSHVLKHMVLSTHRIPHRASVPSSESSQVLIY
ncbi:putative disease resistance protein RGA4, partial [Ananas comosus]